MTLTPDGYRPRIQDAQLGRMLGLFGAVEVAGTMWCGKTWTSLAHGESVSRVGRESLKRTAEADPTAALIGDAPHVVDEWQEVPAIWDAVRDSVDSGGGAGRFILTGSSTPRKDEVSHSGAGRIGRMRMRTMTLAEMGKSTREVSLSGLFSGKFSPCLAHSTLAPLADAICHGGWPALLDAETGDVAEYLSSYLDAITQVSVPKRGLRPGVASRVLRSLARNVGTAATLRTMAADVFPDEDPSVGTSPQRLSSYVEVMESLYVVEPVGGWDAPVRSRSRVRTSPKRYFADPSLPAALLGMTPARLLEDGQLLGVLFESLCMHDLAVYAEAVPGAGRSPLRYYRDSDGLEVDAVIELSDGRWAGIEVKLGENGVEKGLSSLSRLRRKVAANPAARNPEPEFTAVLVGAGESARYVRDAGSYVIPVGVLGP